MTVFTRLKNLEKYAKPKVNEMHLHIISRNREESTNDAIYRYESHTGRKVNDKDQLVILLNYI